MMITGLVLTWISLRPCTITTTIGFDCKLQKTLCSPQEGDHSRDSSPDRTLDTEDVTGSLPCGKKKKTTGNGGTGSLPPVEHEPAAGTSDAVPAMIGSLPGSGDGASSNMLVLAELQKLSSSMSILNNTVLKQQSDIAKLKSDVRPNSEPSQDGTLVAWARLARKPYLPRKFSKVMPRLHHQGQIHDHLSLLVCR